MKSESLTINGQVSWGKRIYHLHHCKGVRLPPTSALNMALNNLMMRL